MASGSVWGYSRSSRGGGWLEMPQCNFQWSKEEGGGGGGGGQVLAEGVE